jgi:Family of unknown function (DUF5684)
MENYDSSSSGMGMFAGAIGIIYLVILLLIIASVWKIFTKAGKPGWAAIIPIYNLIVLLEIVGKPAWWFILFLIPVVGLVIAIIVVHRLSLSFGQGIGTTILLIVLPFIGYPMLAFGSAKYVGAPAN